MAGGVFGDSIAPPQPMQQAPQQAGRPMAPQQMPGQNNPLNAMANQLYVQQQQIAALTQAMTELQARQLAMTIEFVRGQDGRLSGARVFEQRV